MLKTKFLQKLRLLDSKFKGTARDTRHRETSGILLSVSASRETRGRNGSDTEGVKPPTYFHNP